MILYSSFQDVVIWGNWLEGKWDFCCTSYIRKRKAYVKNKKSVHQMKSHLAVFCLLDLSIKNILIEDSSEKTE